MWDVFFARIISPELCIFSSSDGRDSCVPLEKQRAVIGSHPRFPAMLRAARALPCHHPTLGRVLQASWTCSFPVLVQKLTDQGTPPNPVGPDSCGLLREPTLPASDPRSQITQSPPSASTVPGTHRQ